MWTASLRHSAVVLKDSVGLGAQLYALLPAVVSAGQGEVGTTAPLLHPESPHSPPALPGLLLPRHHFMFPMGSCGYRELVLLGWRGLLRRLGLRVS